MQSITLNQFARFVLFLLVGPLIGLTGIALAEGIHFAEYVVHDLIYANVKYLLFLTLPLGLPLLIFMQDRFFPGVEGSGIPKAIVAYRKANLPAAPAASLWDDLWNGGWSTKFLSLKLFLAKYFVTVTAIMVGCSVGPEGPMVFLGCCIASAMAKIINMPWFHQKSAILAGSCASLAAAFNSPMGGLAFGVEEISGEYEVFSMRAVAVAVVALSSVLVAAIIGPGHVFLGARTAPWQVSDIFAAPIIGAVLGVVGGLFARIVAESAKFRKLNPELVKKYNYPFAAAMGLFVAMLGMWADGMVYGPGETMSNRILNEASNGGLSSDFLLHIYGPLKFLATLACAITNLSGGLFVPGHSVGIGFGVYMTYLCPWATKETVIVYSMIGYFSGFTQGPWNTALIGVEITAMGIDKVPGALVTGIVAAMVSKIVCPYPFYTYVGRVGSQDVPPKGVISNA